MCAGGSASILGERQVLALVAAGATNRQIGSAPAGALSRRAARRPRRGAPIDTMALRAGGSSARERRPYPVP
jgi:hypothetical protein